MSVAEEAAADIEGGGAIAAIRLDDTHADSEAEVEAAGNDHDDKAAIDAETARAHQFWDTFFTLEGSAQQQAPLPSDGDLSGSGAGSRAHQGAAHTLSLQASVGQSIEWIASHAELERAGVFAHPLAPLRRSDRILIVGCGSSALGAQLYDEGFEHISSMDVSSVAIERMRAAHAARRPGMAWWVGSCCDMRREVPDASFDVVIDKGTADTLQFRTKARRSHQLLMQMLREVHRVLRPRGVYYCITPRRRLTQLYQPDLHWTVHRIRVHVAGQERRVHKDLTEEHIRDDAWVQLCIKAPQGEGATAEGQEAAGDNRPRTVREAQQLLRMVQQHQQLHGIHASATAAAAASSSCASSTVAPVSAGAGPAAAALPVLSRSALQLAFRTELLSQPCLAPGTHTDTLVCFEAEVTSKRKLSRKLVIYGATVRGDGEGETEDMATVDEPRPADAAAAAAPDAMASGCSDAPSSSPSATFVVNMRGLEMLSQFEDHVYVPSDGDAAPEQRLDEPLAPDSAASATAGAATAAATAAAPCPPLAVACPALADFTSAHSLVRKGDAVRVQGFIGLSRANCPVIFVRSVTLLAVGQQRLLVLKQRATYHGLGQNPAATADE